MKISMVWEDRWQSLKAIIADLEQEGLPGPTFKSLLACLGAFGESQFRFFYDGFQKGRLYPSTLYPAEYALQTTLTQVAYDVTAIQQACHQHQPDNPTLKKAGQLAQMALNLAVESKLLKATTNISYFDKSPRIRTIPYAPLALVGVPFTSTAVSRDFLATPHEIGHHVYWHSPGLSADLRSRLPIQPEWLSRWQAEIFADVYGCLVAGPVIGLDFQDILLDNDWDLFISDDGEHPIDAIRPYIYSRALAELGCPNAAKALNKRWQTKLRARNDPQELILDGGFGSVSLKEARAKVEELTSQILTYLTDVRGVKPPKAWSQDIGSGQDVESLYLKFDEWVSQPLPVAVPELLEDGDEVGVMIDGRLTNKRRKGDAQTWMDQVKKMPSAHLPREVWVPILVSEGWTVNGPEEDPDGPY